MSMPSDDEFRDQIAAALGLRPDNHGEAAKQAAWARIEHRAAILLSEENPDRAAAADPKRRDPARRPLRSGLTSLAAFLRNWYTALSIHAKAQITLAAAMVLAASTVAVAVAAATPAPRVNDQGASSCTVDVVCVNSPGPISVASPMPAPTGGKPWVGGASPSSSAPHETCPGLEVSVIEQPDTAANDGFLITAHVYIPCTPPPGSDFYLIDPNDIDLLGIAVVPNIKIEVSSGKGTYLIHYPSEIPFEDSLHLVAIEAGGDISGVYGGPVEPQIQS